MGARWNVRLRVGKWLRLNVRVRLPEQTVIDLGALLNASSDDEEEDGGSYSLTAAVVEPGSGRPYFGFVPSSPHLEPWYEEEEA